ncbi:uncharacterized protein LOC133176175 [Saccostrea echinata]|uniref:uncharacterized protein LOC133176175 n=1 Tax=Saccostrea echinata TaxID=191078 RepID=UPI002A81674F|nr:uncharacterized protein LOC133176175 [Saccostrea echinata]
MTAVPKLRAPILPSPILMATSFRKYLRTFLRSFRLNLIEVLPSPSAKCLPHIKACSFVPSRPVVRGTDYEKEIPVEKGNITGTLKLQKDIHIKKLTDEDLTKIKTNFQLQSLFYSSKRADQVIVKGNAVNDVQNALLYLDKFLTGQKRENNLEINQTLNLSTDESSEQSVLFLLGFKAKMKKYLSKETKCTLHLEICPPYSVTATGDHYHVSKAIQKLETFIERILKQHNICEMVPFSVLDTGGLYQIYLCEDLLQNHPLFKPQNQLAQLGKDPSFFLMPNFSQLPYGMKVFANSNEELFRAKELVKNVLLLQKKKCFKRVAIKEDDLAFLNASKTFSENLRKKTQCTFIMTGKGTSIEKHNPPQVILLGPTMASVDNAVKDVKAFIDHKDKLFLHSEARTVKVLKFTYNKHIIQSLLKSDGEILYELEKETGCNIHFKGMRSEGVFSIVLTGENEEQVLKAGVVVRRFFEDHSKMFKAMKIIKLPCASEDDNFLFDFLLGRDKASHRKKLERDHKCKLVLDLHNHTLKVYSETQEQLKEAVIQVENVIQEGVENFAELKFRRKLHLEEDLGGHFIKKICSGVGSLQGALERETQCTLIIRGQNGSIGFSHSNKPFHILVCAKTQALLEAGMKTVSEVIKKESEIYRMEFFFHYNYNPKLVKNFSTLNKSPE